MRLSIVATLYRSAAHLREFHARVSAAAARLSPDYEIVLVNDGSPDDSLDVALDLHAADPRVRIVDLSRNFGHHKAMMTGLAHARGELVFLIDCDLEEEPESLATFMDTMTTTGADVVYGVQKRRRGGAFERWSGALFFTAFNTLSDQPIPANLITMRLMTRRYVSALVSHQEREMVIAGLWAITGFRQVPLEVVKLGKSATTYQIAHKVSILVNGITSFSARPLEFIFYLGVGIGAVSGLAAVYLVLRRLFFGTMLAGWPSLIVSMWLLGGLMLSSIGVIGIYLSKIFIETKQRPYTIVRHFYERPTGEADLTAGEAAKR